MIPCILIFFIITVIIGVPLLFMAVVIPIAILFLVLFAKALLYLLPVILLVGLGLHVKGELESASERRREQERQRERERVREMARLASALRVAEERRREAEARELRLRGLEGKPPLPKWLDGPFGRGLVTVAAAAWQGMSVASDVSSGPAGEYGYRGRGGYHGPYGSPPQPSIEAPDTKVEAEPSAAKDGTGACVICIAGVADTLIMPCKHLALCESCSGHMVPGGSGPRGKCPVCRGVIADQIKVFRC